MKKLGPGSRATFISPYLRRPLRTLNKVLSEREEEELDVSPRTPANDARSEVGPVAWTGRGKPAVASD